MDSIIRQIIEVREGGLVERAHTVPHLGSYNNAQHQWGAAMLYLQLRRGTHDPATVVVILTHDLGERWAGDLPAPTKWKLSTPANRELHTIEEKCLRYLGFSAVLSPEEARWAKAVDLLELFLWSHEQIALGNQNVKVIVANIRAFVDEHWDDLPEEVQHVYDVYAWDRTSDRFPF
jgi:5'-deoxynucleotidase YfbR-like HD superfamily hydrolase